MHYWYTTKDDFEKGIGEGRFLEYAFVHKLNYYGTSFKVNLPWSTKLSILLGCPGKSTAIERLTPVQEFCICMMRHHHNSSWQSAGQIVQGPANVFLQQGCWVHAQAVEDVASAGKCCVLDIDVQGARLVRKSKLRAIFVFVAPPSTEELERRLRGRGTETEEQVDARMKTAKEEIARCGSSHISRWMDCSDLALSCCFVFRHLPAADCPSGR